MSSCINQVFLLGHCGDAADHLNGGGIAFSLATSERWTDDNGQPRERTDWHRVVIFGKRAEGLAPIIRKGLRITVQGRLRCESYEDRDGIKRRSVDVIAADVVLLSPRESDDAAPTARPARTSSRGRTSTTQRHETDERDNPADGGAR